MQILQHMTIPGWLNAVDDAGAMTQGEIAQRCGVDVSQVSRWKLHGNVPQVVAFMKLVDLSRTVRLADGRPCPINLDQVPVRKRGPKSRRSARRRAAAAG
jgi:hypothetical protein